MEHHEFFISTIFNRYIANPLASLLGFHPHHGLGYLEALGISLSYKKSFQIFMAGLTMTVAPGLKEAAVEVTASDVAAYHDGSQVQAAFSRDQTVIRLLAHHDLGVRHEESLVMIEAVTWTP